MHRSLAVMLAGLLFLAARAGAEEDDTLCGACKTRGRIENPVAAKWTEREGDVWMCSTALDADPDGSCSPFLPCPRCKNPPLQAAAQAEFDAWVEERRQWLAARRQIDQELRVDLVHIRTQHFLIAWEPDRYKTRDKKTLDPHEAAHLLARRLEGQYADFQRLFQFDDQRVRNSLHEVMVFRKGSVMTRACQRYLSMWSDTAAKVVGDPSIFVTWLSKSSFPDDNAFDRHISHHMTHLLYSVFHLREWLHEYAFLDEGLAHYFEFRYFASADNSCNQEGIEEDLDGSDWPGKVLRMVRSGKYTSLPELVGKRTDQIAGEEHALAWSLCEYLIQLGPEKMRELWVLLKEKAELRDALQQVYGVNLLQLETRWKSHVEEVYPGLKPLKRDQPPPVVPLRDEFQPDR